MRRRAAMFLLEIWFPIALVATWWFTSENSKSFFFPPLRTIVHVFRETWLFARVRSDLEPSLIRFGEGFFLAVLSGVGVGLVFGLWSLGRRSLMPTIDFARSIPSTALVSVWVVVLGFGNLMKVTAIVFVAFFPILLNTIDGVRGVDPNQLEMAKAYGVGRRNRIFRIVVPSASPQIFTGLRIGLAMAVLMMAFSEMVAGTNGVGFFIYFTQQTFRIPEMWTGIVLLGLIGYGVNLLFVLAERRMLRWHRGWRATARETGGG